MWGGSLWDLIGELTLIGNGNNEGFLKQNVYYVAGVVNSAAMNIEIAC